MKLLPRIKILMPSMVLMAMAVSARGTTKVNLGTAGNFVILSKSGISTTVGTSIVGDIGVSPIHATAITGFGLILDPSGQFSTSSLVTGKVFASDYSVPTPTVLGMAIGGLHTAYTDAAGRSGPDFLNLLGGNLNGQTLAPGLYKWGSAVTITNSVTISGGGDSNAVWIFQIDKRLSLANGAHIILSNGAQASNIFWQTAGGATLGTSSHFEGNLLTAKDIAVQTGASVNGNLYAETAVTLQSNAITTTSGTYVGNGLLSVIVAKNDPAPGITGSKFLHADCPAVDSFGDLVFKASVTGTARPNTITSTNNIGIWYYTGSSTSLLARTGTSAPGTTGAVFTSLSDPAMHEDGSVAFAGGLAGGDVLKNKSNATGVWLIDTPLPHIVVRSGSSAADQPDGQYKLFEQIVTQQATDVAFLATLTGASVNPKTNTGLWGVDLSGTLHSVVRTGESITTGTSQRTVATINAFPIKTNEQGQSRSVDTVDGHLTFVISFTDKSSAICAATPQSSGFNLEILAATWDASVPGVPQTRWSDFGNPAVNANGTIAFEVALVNTATKAKSSGLWLDSGTTTTLMAVSGQAAPDCGGALFSTFEDPVLNNNDQIAFIGSLQTARNLVTAKTASGIWTNTSGTMSLVARIGSSAPGTSGLFSEFDQIVLPDVGGPVFLAKLTGVKSTVNTGVWCVDSDGQTHLLIQTGDVVDVHGVSKVITSFSIFNACPQVAGQSRSFDASTRTIVFIATFRDNTWAILQAVAP
jgi:hypothetical protein